MKKCIPTKDAEEGMVLAKEVTNEKGVTLCAEGTSLTADLIERFNQMAITEIYVENNQQLSAEDYAELQQKLEQRFSLSENSHSLLGKLKTVLLLRLESRKGSL